MKKTLLLSCLLMMSAIAFAQSNAEEVDLVQSVFGMEKKAMVAEFIQLEGAQKDSFWKTYDEYEVKRKELGKKRIELLNKYASSYATLTDETADKLILDFISLQESTDKLIATYYKKIKKETGVIPAAKFFQIEGYILSKLRAELMENIPLMEKFDK